MNINGEVRVLNVDSYQWEGAMSFKNSALDISKDPSK